MQDQRLLDLRERVAVVTGASGSFGAESARALAGAGADELAGDGILVNAVNPNAAEGPLGDTMIEELAAAQGVSGKQVRNYLVGSTPLGRLTRPADVAVTVLFYAPDLSTFVTGTSLTID